MTPCASLLIIFAGVILVGAIVTFRAKDWLAVLGATTFLVLIAFIGSLVIWFIRSVL